MAGDSFDVTLGDEPDTGTTTDAGVDLSSSDDASTQSQPASSVLGAFIRERGFDVPEGATDDDLFGNIQTWAKRASAIPEELDPEELVRVHGEYSQHRDAFQQYLQSRGQQQPAPVQPQPQPVAQHQPVAQPALDHNAIEMFKQVCVWDQENGVYKPKVPGFEAQAAKLNELAYQRRQNLERISEDPDAYISTRAEKIAEERAKAIVEERLKALMPDIESWREYQAQQQQDQFIAPFRAQLVQAGPNGEVLSAKGEIFKQAFDSAPESLTQLQRLTWAKNQADAWAAQQPAAPASQKPGWTLKPIAQQVVPAQQPNTQQQAALTPQPPAPNTKKNFVDSGRHQSRDPQTGQFVNDRSALVNAAMNNGEPTGRGRSFTQIAQDLKNNGFN